MSKEILVQFVGFESKAAVREYTFQVKEAAAEPREFAITIAHEAFTDHRLSFQDAPDLCSARLRRELTETDNQPVESRFHITDEELAQYRDSHTPAKRKTFQHKTFQH